MLIAFFNLDFLKSFEVLPDVNPFNYKAGVIQTPIKFFSEDQYQEAAKHMASDGRIALMVNRTCFEWYFLIGAVIAGAGAGATLIRGSGGRISGPEPLPLPPDMP